MTQQAGVQRTAVPGRVDRDWQAMEASRRALVEELDAGSGERGCAKQLLSPVQQRGDAWRSRGHAVRVPVQKDPFQGRQIIEYLLSQTEFHRSRWKWSKRTHGHNDPSLAVRRAKGRGPSTPRPTD